MGSHNLCGRGRGPDFLTRNPQQIDAVDSPTAWFAVLERARRTNDAELARRAQRELRRLAVVVMFLLPDEIDDFRDPTGYVSARSTA